jgi:hypothetical protein
MGKVQFNDPSEVIWLVIVIRTPFWNVIFTKISLDHSRSFKNSSLYLQITSFMKLLEDFLATNQKKNTNFHEYIISRSIVIVL